MKFENVTAEAVANIYFDGKVISHSILLPDGKKKTLGVILPGTYHFSTESAELMEIVAGTCQVTLDDSDDKLKVPANSSFKVPALSGFTIKVTTDPCHYVCSFL